MTEAVAADYQLDSSKRNLYVHFLQHRNSLKLHLKYGSITIIVQPISFRMQIALLAPTSIFKLTNITLYINLSLLWHCLSLSDHFSDRYWALQVLYTPYLYN